MYAGLFGAGERAQLELADNRGAWVHVARGNIKVNDQLLGEGDGLALEGERTIRVEGVDDAEVIVFDLG
jgi:quercetin 2,3-dioxygenase